MRLVNTDLWARKTWGLTIMVSGGCLLAYFLSLLVGDVRIGFVRRKGGWEEGRKILDLAKL